MVKKEINKLNKMTKSIVLDILERLNAMSEKEKIEYCNKYGKTVQKMQAGLERACYGVADTYITRCVALREEIRLGYTQSIELAEKVNGMPIEIVVIALEDRIAKEAVAEFEQSWKQYRRRLIEAGELKENPAGMEAEEQLLLECELRKNIAESCGIDFELVK